MFVRVSRCLGYRMCDSTTGEAVANSFSSISSLCSSFRLFLYSYVWSVAVKNSCHTNPATVLYDANRPVVQGCSPLWRYFWSPLVLEILECKPTGWQICEVWVTSILSQRLLHKMTNSRAVFTNRLHINSAQYLASILTDRLVRRICRNKIVHKKNGACTRGTILTRLSICNGQMA